jgi:hypothetical protein
MQQSVASPTAASPSVRSLLCTRGACLRTACQDAGGGCEGLFFDREDCCDGLVCIANTCYPQSCTGTVCGEDRFAGSPQGSTSRCCAYQHTARYVTNGDDRGEVCVDSDGDAALLHHTMCEPQTCGPGQSFIYGMTIYTAHINLYVDGGWNSNVDCASCARGRYRAESHHTSASCQLCGAGQYQDQTGSASCKSCQSGRTSASGSAASSDCYETSRNCSQGQYQYPLFEVDPDNSRCEPCPPGRYESSSNHALEYCTACSAGQYQDESGSSACKLCPADTSFTPQAEGSESASDCLPYDLGAVARDLAPGTAMMDTGYAFTLGWYTDAACTQHTVTVTGTSATCTAINYNDKILDFYAYCPPTGSNLGAFEHLRVDEGCDGSEYDRTAQRPNSETLEVNACVCLGDACPYEYQKLTCLRLEAAASIQSEATYDADIADIPEGSAQRAAFEQDFIEAVSSAMSVIDPIVTINSIRAGSIIVDFTVTVPAEFEATATQMFDIMASSPTALVIDLDGAPLAAPTVADPTVDGPRSDVITLKTAAGTRSATVGLLLALVATGMVALRFD